MTYWGYFLSEIIHNIRVFPLKMRLNQINYISKVFFFAKWNKTESNSNYLNCSIEHCDLYLKFWCVFSKLQKTTPEGTTGSCQIKKQIWNPEIISYRIDYNFFIELGKKVFVDLCLYHHIRPIVKCLSKFFFLDFWTQFSFFL